MSQAVALRRRVLARRCRPSHRTAARFLVRALYGGWRDESWRLRVECGNPRHLRNHGHWSGHLVRVATRGVRIKVATCLLVLVLIVGIFSTHRSVRRSRSEAERYFALRLAIFSW